VPFYFHAKFTQISSALHQATSALLSCGDFHLGFDKLALLNQRLLLYQSIEPLTTPGILCDYTLLKFTRQASNACNTYILIRHIQTVKKGQRR
jgi:hypothetical protein